MCTSLVCFFCVTTIYNIVTVIRSYIRSYIRRIGAFQTHTSHIPIIKDIYCAHYTWIYSDIFDVLFEECDS